MDVKPRVVFRVWGCAVYRLGFNLMAVSRLSDRLGFDLMAVLGFCDRLGFGLVAVLGFCDRLGLNEQKWDSDRGARL